MSLISFVGDPVSSPSDHSPQYLHFFVHVRLRTHPLGLDFKPSCNRAFELSQLGLPPHCHEVISVHHCSHLALRVEECTARGLTLPESTRLHECRGGFLPIESCLASAVQAHVEFAALALVALFPILFWNSYVHFCLRRSMKVCPPHVNIQ
eukprot:6284499-Karenia_brevis.AAC.1